MCKCLDGAMGSWMVTVAGCSDLGVRRLHREEVRGVFIAVLLRM
jgi:hypothetical protein